MLVKLTPDQVNKYWELISFSIRESLPPIAMGAEDRMSRILVSAMTGGLDVWMSMVKKTMQVDGVATTCVTRDDNSEIRNLLIYSVYGMGEGFVKNSWMSALKTFKDYARGLGCSRIIAYTDEDSIKKFAEILGGETRYTFISFPVDEITVEDYMPQTPEAADESL